MTEQEWSTAKDPAAMLDWLQPWINRCLGDPANLDWPSLSDRKLRLFVAAVERLWWGDKASKQDEAAIRLMEAFADNESVDFHRIQFSWTMPFDAMECAAECVRFHNSKGDPPLWAALLRDVFGNPWQTVSEQKPADGRRFEIVGNLSQWLAWNDGVIHKLAQAMYNSRVFNAMPILGDMLQEAGCKDAETLRHCKNLKPCINCVSTGSAKDDFRGCSICKDTRFMKSSAPHVRGCWVVDLILGKT